jgi:hypothetical protein
MLLSEQTLLVQSGKRGKQWGGGRKKERRERERRR